MDRTVWLLSCVLLIYALWPQEAYVATEYWYKQIQILVLNYYLMIKAYLIYRRIAFEMGKIGLPRPPFRFTPIWQRD